MDPASRAVGALGPVAAVEAALNRAMDRRS